jgi:cytochrome d ubiquinol oxidase subunit II
VFLRSSREGRAFAATALTIGAAVVTLFLALWPDVMPADIAANSLTVRNASSTDYTLEVMSFVALAGLPVVLLYQGWTYWVFRQRLTRSHIAPAPCPRRRSASAVGHDGCAAVSGPVDRRLWREAAPRSDGPRLRRRPGHC